MLIRDVHATQCLSHHGSGHVHGNAQACNNAIRSYRGVLLATKPCAIFAIVVLFGAIEEMGCQCLSFAQNHHERDKRDIIDECIVNQIETSSHVQEFLKLKDDKVVWSQMEVVGQAWAKGSSNRL